MNEELRWPHFAERAAKRGINAILSTPLVVDEPDLGALNVYSNRPFAFGGVERMTASVFAAQASAVLQAQAMGDASGEALGQCLQSTLHLREVEAFRRALLAWSSLTAAGEQAEETQETTDDRG